MRAEIGQATEQARPLHRFALGAPDLVGNEVDLDRPAAEEQSGVDIGVARPGPELESLPRRADDLALADLVASRH